MNTEIPILPPDSWDISKSYHSPSGERVAIYVNGRWTQYIREDAVSEVINQAIAQYEETKKANAKPPQLILNQ